MIRLKAVFRQRFFGQPVISATAVSTRVLTVSACARRRLQPTGQSGTRVVRRGLTQHDCFFKKTNERLTPFLVLK